ncbi:hypothetical protein GCM10027447_25010 [Glycomyces halotolerans]
MRTLLRLCTVVMLACAAWAPASAAHADDRPRVLAVTAGNDNPEVAEYALERLGMEARRWQFDLVEGEPSDLADLDRFDVVMLLNTSGDILDRSQQDALETFVESGGGLVGTHSAAVTEPDWDWWQESLGATALEPPTEPASKQTVEVAEGSPITDGIDEELELTERWFYFDPEPTDADTEILAHLGSGDPVAWAHDERDVFYTVPGGDYETWGDRDFLQLIRQAIWWAAGEERQMVQYTGDAAPTWPYTLTFVLFVLAVAGGGSLAVWRLDRTEAAGAESGAAAV